jgi:putative hydrolase of the HAD superfamily
MSSRALVIDMDGTLIECGKYYVDTKNQGAAYLSAITGIAQDAALKMLEAIDLAAVSLPGSFSADRFPKSFEAAASAACHLAFHQKPELAPFYTHMNQMREIGRSVFDAPYEEFAGVRHALTELKSQGWNLVLLTKGDTEVQQRKIALHGYERIFNVRVITLTKNVDVLKSVCDKFGIIPAQSWSIGDSVKDDIAPAKALGFRTIRVKDHTPWAYDTGTEAADFAVDTFAEVLNILSLSAEKEAQVAS